MFAHNHRALVHQAANRHWERLARSLGLGSDEAHARIMALAERLPDALADAASESSLTVDERRVGDTIRDQITKWSAARSAAME